MKSALRPVSAIGARPVSGRPRPQGVPRVVGPVNIPSIKAENNGLDPSVSLVPASASGWGQAINSSSTAAAKPGAWSASSAPTASSGRASSPPPFDNRRSDPPPRQNYPLERQQFPDLADVAASAGRSDSSSFVSLRPQSFMDRQQGPSSGPYGHTHREMERPMESYRNNRRHEDDYHDHHQHGRVQYQQQQQQQQQRYPPAPASSDRHDSRRMPSPPRAQQQQQQQRQTSDDTNRRISSGSTHDWADDDDGEMNFNEPLLIVSNRSGDSGNVIAASSSNDDPAAQLLKEQARLQDLKLQQELRRLQRQNEVENTVYNDQPRQAWGQPSGQNYDQQQHRAGAADTGRKVWMEGRDPYNRQQPDDSRRYQQQHQQQVPGPVYMTHEQRFESMQRGSGMGASLRSSAPATYQQPHGAADAGAQFRSNSWNRPHEAVHQHHEGHGSMSEDAQTSSEGIAVGDDYSRAQQGSSAPHMLYNHRTNSFEPTQPPMKDPAPRSQQQVHRGWGVPAKTKPTSSDAIPAGAVLARSILKAPAPASSPRVVQDPKSLKEEASAEREQRRRLAGRPADFISLGLAPSVRAAAPAPAAAVTVSSESAQFMDDSAADESSIVNLLASEVAADYFQPAASADSLSSLSSSAAPYERPSASSAVSTSVSTPGAGLLQPPHAQATGSTVWTPLHANASGGLFQVFASAPNGSAALPGWNAVTGGVDYGGQSALQYGAVQFNQGQWMQLGPAAAAGPIHDSGKYQHLAGLWNDAEQGILQPQGHHQQQQQQQQVAAATNQQQQHGMQPRYGLWGAPQGHRHQADAFPLSLGSLSGAGAAMGSPWLPPTSINFQSFTGNGDHASSDRGFAGSAPSFVPGASNGNLASTPGGSGSMPKTGRGGKSASGALSGRPAYSHPDGSAKSKAPAAASALPAWQNPASTAAPRSNRRGRGGKGPEGSSA